MALDLQPVPKQLDLRPVSSPAARKLDLQPVSSPAARKLDLQPMLKSNAPKEALVVDKAAAVRELFDPPKKLDLQPAAVASTPTKEAPGYLKRVGADIQRAGRTIAAPLIYNDAEYKQAQKEGKVPDITDLKGKTSAQRFNEGPLGTAMGAIYAPISEAVAPILKRGTDYAQKKGVTPSQLDKVQAGLNFLGLVGAPKLGKIGRAGEVSEALPRGEPLLETPGAAKTAKPLDLQPVSSAAPAETASKSTIFSEDAPVATTQPTTTPRGIADRLFANKQRATADQHDLLKYIQGNAPKVPEGVWEKINAHLDDPEGVPLTPAEQPALKMVQTLKAEKDAINKQIVGQGFKPEELVGEGEETENLGGATRQVKGKQTPMDRLMGTTEKISLKDRVKGILGAKEIQSPVSSHTLSRSAGSLKQRSMQALTNEKGERLPVYIDRKGRIYDAAKPGEAPIGYRNPDASISLENGNLAKLGQATQREIETATKGRIQYHKNALGVEATSLLQSRRALRNVQTFKEIMADPEAYSVVRRASKAPKDWEHVKGFPNESKYKFEPRFAEEIQDFIGGMNKNMGELTLLEALNRFTMGAFFWLNPEHIYNVVEAFTVTKGATGFARDLPSTAGDFARAVKSVATRDKIFMQQMRAGVPLRGMDSMTQKFNRGLLQAMDHRLQTDPRGFTEFAKAFGMKPVQLIKRIGEASHNATFTIQDILQQTLERGMARKGIGQAEATESIAKTLPPYRTPARIAGSRMLGKAAKGSTWLQFPGWDVGRLQGLGNILKGSAKLDKKSLDQLLMIAVLYEFGKQVADPLVQQATGNKQAEAPTAGYGVFPRHVERILNSDETLGQALQSLFPPGYLPQAVELGLGTDLYTGKHISTPGEKPAEIGYDYLQHAATRIDPIRRALDMQSGKETPGEAALAQIGIKDPSPKEVAGRNKAKKYNRQQLKQKRKQEPDIIQP